MADTNVSLLNAVGEYTSLRSNSTISRYGWSIFPQQTQKMFGPLHDLLSIIGHRGLCCTLFRSPISELGYARLLFMMNDYMINNHGTLHHKITENHLHLSV